MSTAVRTIENTSIGQTAPSKSRFPRFGLSATQLVATALAAITATFAASYFGVAGTVVGAALVSVVTAAGKEVYSQSIRSTGVRVRAVVPVTRSPAEASEPAPGPARRPMPGLGATDQPPVLPARTPPIVGTERATRWRRLAVGTMAVFVAVLAVITGVEIVAGRPLSDLLRGESGSGTSFFGNQQVRTKTVPPTAPTVTMTVTPKVVITTPTVTRTAPPSTTTTTPSTSSTPSTSTSTPAGRNSSASTGASSSAASSSSSPAR